MLDVSVSYNRYKFIGHEFLTWLWFTMEKDPDRLRRVDPDLASLNIGNRLVLENSRNHDGLETITIKGDAAGLEEGILALKKGAVVTELNLVYTSGDQEWRFTLKGESLNVSNLKTPETGGVESRDDIEGAVLEKAYLYEKIIQLMDGLYNTFIRLRVSGDWPDKTVPFMKNWIGGK